MSFTEWLNAIDTLVRQQAYGFGIDDLPDLPYRALFNDGSHPQEVADQLLADAGLQP